MPTNKIPKTHDNPQTGGFAAGCGFVGLSFLLLGAAGWGAAYWIVKIHEHTFGSQEAIGTIGLVIVVVVCVMPFLLPWLTVMKRKSFAAGFVRATLLGLLIVAISTGWAQSRKLRVTHHREARAALTVYSPDADLLGEFASNGFSTTADPSTADIEANRCAGDGFRGVFLANPESHSVFAVVSSPGRLYMEPGASSGFRIYPEPCTNRTALRWGTQVIRPPTATVYLVYNFPRHDPHILEFINSLYEKGFDLVTHPDHARYFLEITMTSPHPRTYYECSIEISDQRTSNSRNFVAKGGSTKGPLILKIQNDIIVDMDQEIKDDDDRYRLILMNEILPFIATTSRD